MVDGRSISVRSRRECQWSILGLFPVYHRGDRPDDIGRTMKSLVVQVVDVELDGDELQHAIIWDDDAYGLTCEFDDLLLHGGSLLLLRLFEPMPDYVRRVVSDKVA
jgi:hypothetical protein